MTNGDGEGFCDDVPAGGRFDGAVVSYSNAAKAQLLGVPDEVIDPCLEEHEGEWQDFIAGVREKKFGKKLPADYKEQAKQSRFLQYRGFTGEQISRLFRHSD